MSDYENLWKVVDVVICFKHFSLKLNCIVYNFVKRIHVDSLSLALAVASLVHSEEVVAQGAEPLCKMRKTCLVI